MSKIVRDRKLDEELEKMIKSIKKYKKIKTFKKILTARKRNEK